MRPPYSLQLCHGCGDYEFSCELDSAVDVVSSYGIKRLEKGSAEERGAVKAEAAARASDDPFMLDTPRVHIRPDLCRPCRQPRVISAASRE